MVCGLPTSAGFQPALPTASRCATKLRIGVPSRRKCVCMSITNWPFSESARAAVLLRELVAQILDARLELFLLRGLRRRHELVARHELHRNRRREQRFG